MLNSHFSQSYFGFVVFAFNQSNLDFFVFREMDQERDWRAKREEKLSKLAREIIQPLLDDFNDTLVISKVIKELMHCVK